MFSLILFVEISSERYWGTLFSQFIRGKGKRREEKCNLVQLSYKIKEFKKNQFNMNV